MGLFWYALLHNTIGLENIPLLNMKIGTGLLLSGSASLFCIFRDFLFFILYFEEKIFFILYFPRILYSVFSWFCNSLFSIFKISIYLFCIFRNPYSSFSNNWFAFYHAHSTRNNVILSCYYIINIGHEKIDMFFVLEIVLF